MKANDIQIGGQHYKKASFQPWDWERYGVGGLEWTAIKYVTRYKDKSGIEDLNKAIHYVEKIIEEHKNHGRLNKLIRDSNKALDSIETLFDQYCTQNQLDKLQRITVQYLLYWLTPAMLTHCIALIQDMIDAYSASNVLPAKQLEGSETK